MTRKKPKLVVIYWKDAYGSLESVDFSEEDLPPFCPVASVGILVKEDKEKSGSVYLASEEVAGEGHRGVTVIPKSLIIRRDKLMKKK